MSIMKVALSLSCLTLNISHKMLARPTVGIIGGGSWGTALALAAHRAGSKVTLATRNKNVIASIGEHRINDIYLPHIFIDPDIMIADDFKQACDSEIVVMAMPSHCLRSACISISDYLPTQASVVVGCKGIERGSLLLMHEVVQSVMPKNPVAVISGPNFASEVARGKPSATTIACTDRDIGNRLVYAMGSKFFRPYLSDDIIGAQIGGALKNIIAIACGIAFGRQLGENARAALITRGYAEMVRLCLAKGGKQETLMGLSGIGDLILTCSSVHSRNTSFGLALSKGSPVGEVLVNEGRGVIEGAVSAESAHKLAIKHQLEMPICDTIYKILHENMEIEAAVNVLLDRPFKLEQGTA